MEKYLSSTSCNDGLYGKASIGEELDATSPKAKKDLEKRQTFVKKLFEYLAIAHSKVKDRFYLEISEYANGSTSPKWSIYATNQEFADDEEYKKKKESFCSNNCNQLFETSLIQHFLKLHTSIDPYQNYAGHVDIYIVMCGKNQGSDWKENDEANRMVYRTLEEYRRGVDEYYSDWTTLYIDNSSVYTMPVDEL